MHDLRRLVVLGIVLFAVAAYVTVTTGSTLTRLVMVGATALYVVGVFQIRQQVRRREQQHQL